MTNGFLLPPHPRPGLLGRYQARDRRSQGAELLPEAGDLGLLSGAITLQALDFGHEQRRQHVILH